MSNDDVSGNPHDGIKPLHADYLEQAGQHFRGSQGPGVRPPAIFRPGTSQPTTPTGEPTAPQRPIAGPTSRTHPPQPSGATINNPQSHAAELAGDPATGRPIAPTHACQPPVGSPVADATAWPSAQRAPRGQAQPHPIGSTSTSDAVNPGGVPARVTGAGTFVLAAVGLFALLVLHSLLISVPAAILLTFVDAAVVLGYLVLRQRRPSAARTLESRALATAQGVISRLTPAMGNAANTLSARITKNSPPYPGFPGPGSRAEPMPPPPGWGHGPAADQSRAPNLPDFDPVPVGQEASGATPGRTSSKQKAWGEAKHKKEHATFRAQTSIDPDGVARLAREVGESLKSLLPGTPFVRFEGAEPGRLLFSVRSWGGHVELMSFCVDIGRNAARFTTVNTHIQGFKTSQTTYMFIPVAPKQLEGYGFYKRYARYLGEALQRYDPQSQGLLVERPPR